MSAEADLYQDLDEPPELKTLEPGTIVAERYRIVDAIGRGGMGVVYKASQIHMGKTVAMKMMLQETSTSSQDYRRFQREAQAASLLDHPNIISIHDFGLSGGQAYLCMDYLEGVSLDEHVENQPLTIDQFRHVFAQACDALQHAHDKGIVHRDLKPSNIMITERRGDKMYVVILDFGLVKMMEPGSDHKLTATNMVVGSPLYMSPEQCRAQKLDQRSDIYSLGCVMYEALTGLPPLRADTIFDLMNAHISQEPEPMRDALPGLYVPVALENVVLKTLAKDPAKRFQSMKELAAAIEESFSGAPELALSRPSPAIKAAATHGAGTKTQEIARKKKQKYDMITGAVIVWIAIASVITAGMFFKQYSNNGNENGSKISAKTAGTSSTSSTTGSTSSSPLENSKNGTDLLASATNPSMPKLTTIQATHYPEERIQNQQNPPNFPPPNTTSSTNPSSSTNPANTTAGQLPNTVAPAGSRVQQPIQFNATPARPLTAEQMRNDADMSFRMSDWAQARSKYETILKERSSSDVQVPVLERLVYCAYQQRDMAAAQEYANRFKNYFYSYPRYADSDTSLLNFVLGVAAETSGKDLQFTQKVLEHCIENARGASAETVKWRMDLSKLMKDQNRESDALRFMEDAQRDAESAGLSDKLSEIKQHIARMRGGGMGGPMGGGLGGGLGGGPMGGGLGGGPMGGGMGGGPMGGGRGGGPMGGGLGGGPMGGGMGGGPMGGPMGGGMGGPEGGPPGPDGFGPR